MDKNISPIDRPNTQSALLSLMIASCSFCKQTNVLNTSAAPLRPPQTAAASVPVAAPDVDLLDFGSFDNSHPPNNAPPPNAHLQPANSAPVAHDVFDPFIPIRMLLYQY